MAKSPAPIATTPTSEVDDDDLLLYLPLLQQIDPANPPWHEDLVLITPKQAADYLAEADAYEGFGQRPRTPARKKRWLSLMRSNRFVFYHPFGPLGFNEDGILMNGGNRLAALADFDKPVGFKVYTDCPTWLINYIDNGNNRNQRDSNFINRRKTDTDTTATIRLGMRYEEFLFGKRPALGWIEWSRHYDEFVDVENFMRNREYLMDMVPRGRLLKKKTDLQPAAGACFIAYQQLAWPDGQDKLEEFLDGLIYGANVSKGHPALTLREWGKNDGFIGGYRRGRREGHLLLLMKHFLLFCEGQRVNEVRVARGLEMAMPYHPDGWDVACKNVREALQDMDNA